MSKLEDKVIVIAGATGDIGGELAIKFAKMRARVVAIGRNRNKLNELLARSPNKMCGVIADLSRMSEVKRVLQEIGRIDLLITSLGTWFEIKKDTDLVDFSDRLNTDMSSIVSAAIQTIFAFNQYFLKEQEGQIVDISSHAAEDYSLAGNLTYGPAKAAVKAFIEFLRKENGRDSGVVISRIVAQLVDTPGNRAKFQQFSDEDWKRAVQIGDIINWIEEHFGDKNADPNPVFVSRLRI